MNFRKAGLTDLEKLYLWANDPQTRENSFCSETIDLLEHEQWLNKKLKDENYFILIYSKEINEDIGLCRLEKNLDSVLLSYSISLEYRGKGYGKKMLKDLEDFLKILDIKKVLAQVKVNNSSSIKLLETLGYVKNFEDGNLVEFTKVL